MTGPRATAGPITAVGVGVPARDEGDRIERCVAALDEAARRVARPVHLVVVADGCTDATAALADRALSRCRALTGRVLDRPAAGVGRARALALDTALADTGAEADRVWLTTSDADTRVPTDWFAGHLAWAARGVDAVSGLVELDPDDVVPGLADRYLSSLGSTATGHRHVHGANLGLRATWWRAVRGCGPHLCGEDHDLWERLEAAGARAIGVEDLTVRTSARLTSRVEGGFADYLSALLER